MKKKTISRRSFLKDAAKCGAAVSAAGFIFPACASGGEYDLVIAGGLVFDGTGASPREADIGISGGVIRSIGGTGRMNAKRTIEARGLAVCPGFIDIHTHTAEQLLVNPKAESTVRQGVTTVVGGNCGESSFPLNDAMFDDMRSGLRTRYGLEQDWKDAAGFFRRLEKNGTAVNYASLVGHGTVRAGVVGYNDRAATGAELDAMKKLVAAAMDQGAVGISTGLEYSPGSFASTGELIELASVLALRGGVYATHIRDEEDGVLEALSEAIEIAAKSRSRLQVSHLKIGYPRNWPKFPALMAAFDRAAASGLRIHADRYPYTAWGTGLSMLFPLWAREGRTEALLGRLKDPGLQAKLEREFLAKAGELGGWDKVLISDLPTDKNRELEGLTILEAARLKDRAPYELVRRLLIEEEGDVDMIAFATSEEHLEALLSHPLVGVGSDGTALAPYGPLAMGKPHPRAYGTFPRVLGKYVRERKLVPLAEMIRKMTSFPADHFGFERRGRIAVGHAADITVFDPERVADKATWTDPAVYPEGIPYVMVNGWPVIDGGEHTGELPGRVLRRTRGGDVR